MVTCSITLISYGISFYWTGSIHQLDNVPIINQSTVVEEGNSNGLYVFFDSLSNSGLEDTEAIKRRIFVSTVVGKFFALITGIFISYVLFPSLVATIFKLLRSVIPNLKHQRDLVLVYRKSLNCVTSLIDGVFLGVFVSCAAVTAISGVMIHLFLDPNIKYFF